MPNDMKLYATVTSERASKGQGGNERLDTYIRIGDREKVKFFLGIGVSENGENYRLELVDMRDSSVDKVLAVIEDSIKGEKQKGECKHDWCAYSVSELICSKCHLIK